MVIWTCIRLKVIAMKLGDAKKNKKNKQIHIRLSDEELSEMEFICSKKGKNKSDIFRDMLRMYGNLVRYQD